MGPDVYRRISNSRYMLAGITGIVAVMSVFTFLMWGIANRIDTMTETIVQLGADIHTMTQVQEVMVQDISAMSTNFGTMQGTLQNMDIQVTAMSRNIAVMTGSTVNMNSNMARMSQDVSRTSSMFSSPMSYFWNMGR